MEVLLMYLWLKLDPLRDLFFIATVIIGFNYAMFAFYCLMEGGGYVPSAEWKKWHDKLRYPSLYNQGKSDPGPEPERVPFRRAVSSRVYVAFASTLFLSFSLPSSKDVAYMVGAHYAVLASESPEAQKIVTLMRKKANEYLDEQLKNK